MGAMGMGSFARAFEQVLARRSAADGVRELGTLLAVLGWLAVWPALAAAQSGGGGLGALAQVLPQSGQSETWRYVNTGDSFEIENIGDPNAIEYFYAGSDGRADGRRLIEAAVAVHPDSQGSAGLLYGLNDARDLYHVMSLDGQGVVRIFRRDSSGFRPMMEQTSSAYLPGKINRLGIQEKGDEIVLMLNGTEMGAIGGDLFGKGLVGIAAIGQVRAFFNLFSDGS